MSSQDNHGRAHMMPTQLVTFLHVLLSPPLLFILAFQPILFDIIIAEGHYMQCSIEELCLKE